jgi:hypothetical protein
MVIIQRVSEASELLGIKSLQQANLMTILPAEEMDREGFVTAEYTLDFLDIMHRSCPSIIAKEKEEVVGYAIATTKSVAHQHPLLADLVNFIDSRSYDGQFLREADYIVVGQLCVAKGFRGQGIVQRMYSFFRDQLSDKYQYCLTDVAIKNPRSLKAHLKSGFTALDTLEFNAAGYTLVIWDWNRKN